MPLRSVSPTVLRSFQHVGRDLFLQGLNSSHSGNMSLREGDLLWITRRGAPLGRLTARDLVSVPLWNPGLRAEMASSELPVHLEVHREMGEGALVHAHPPFAVALSTKGGAIIPLDLEGRFHLGIVPVIEAPDPYDPNAMAGPIARALRESKIIVVRGHGTFAKGSDLFEAFHWNSTLEHSCKIIAFAALRHR